MSATLRGLPALPLPRPWLDRRGRFCQLRAATLTLLLLPGLVLGVQYLTNQLGAKPLTELLHGLGFWSTWLLLASLAVTPAKCALCLPGIVVLRRMIGVSAACYALLHLVLFSADQNWRMLTVAYEIVRRFYLTIGFVALAGLVALAWTSTDEWCKRLGKGWKRLHKLAYPIAVLAVLHFFLQSKIDVSRALLAAGVLAWLMLWRALPSGRDRGVLVLMGLAVASAAVTLGIEFGWYSLATKVDAWKVFRGEFDVSFGLRPAGQVLVLGLLAAAAVGLRRLAQSEHAGTAWLQALHSAGGAAIAFGVIYALGLLPFTDLEGPSMWALAGVWLTLFALLGLARRQLPEAWQRRLVDALWAACALYPLYGLQVENLPYCFAGHALVALAALGLAARLWPVSRRAAAFVAPVAAWVAYAGTTAAVAVAG